MFIEGSIRFKDGLQRAHACHSKFQKFQMFLVWVLDFL